MVGDQADVLGRLKAVLPARWFPDATPGGATATPVLDGLLAGFASAASWLYALLGYARMQTRIATATDVWLDGASADFFGVRLPRLTNESDAQFRRRIQLEILRPRATRAALVQAVTDLTGRAPVVFEPANASDTGGWGAAGAMGYGVAGGWGDLNLPFQFFVTAYRPHGGGIASVAGYGSGAGGYGAGAIEYGSAAMIQGQVTDAEINAAIDAVRPAGTIAWTRITN